MQETDLISRSEIQIALENGLATHFNVLAWRIPWTKEPGSLQWAIVHGVTQLSNFHFLTSQLTQSHMPSEPEVGSIISKGLSWRKKFISSSTGSDPSISCLRIRAYFRRQY